MLLTVEYDGSRFAGWQVQAEGRTVAGVLEGALEELYGEPLRVVGSGRTDEGVHAEAQAANVLLRFSWPVADLVDALNRRLPDDVAVRSAREVSPDLHARHSAVARTYRYQVARRRTVFQHRRSWVLDRAVSLERLRAVTATLPGFRDFGAFCDRRLLAGGSSLVELTRAEWTEAGELLLLHVSASHFLPRMVRRLAGCLVRVGTGQLEARTFARWLEEADGESGPLTAPAMGLFLESVEYPAPLLRPPAAASGGRPTGGRPAPPGARG